MSLSTEAQALFDHARNSLPRWLTGAPSAALEWLYGFTGVFDGVRVIGRAWLDLTYILKAIGAELDQHAADRGTSRRAGESDDALRYRLRQISDAVTEPAILAGVSAIIDGASVPAVLDTNNYVTTGWNSVLFTAATYNNVDPTTQTYGSRLTLQTINDGTNPPSFAYDDTTGAVVIRFAAGVTTYAAVEALMGISNNSVQVRTPSTLVGVMQVGDVFGPKPFRSAGLVALRRDRGHMHTIGSCHAFLSRGYRMTGTGRPMAYIVILPYGTNTATANAVSEYLRQNGPAGYLYYVERRLNP